VEKVRTDVSQGRNKLGKWGEALAATYLQERGCALVASNWRCSAGEVDLIVRDGDCLVFVEVRTRRGQKYGTPEESITPRKMAHMIAVAETYVYEQGWKGNWRLDVVAIQVRKGMKAAIEWYENVSN
jgi:putative endonuclease